MRPAPLAYDKPLCASLDGFGVYIAEGTFLPLVARSTSTAQTTKPSPVGRGLGLGTAIGCAGLQLDFPKQQIQGVADAWVPFGEAIAIGW